MAQAGLGFNVGTPVEGPGQQAGLSPSQPQVTMKDRYSQMRALRRMGFTVDEIDQMVGNKTISAPEASEDPRQGILEEMGFHGRAVAENTLSGMGEIAGDWLGAEGVGDALKSAGDYVGPTDEQNRRQQAEEAWKEERVASGEWSPARKFVSDAGEAVMSGVASIVPTITGGALGFMAGGPVGAAVGASAMSAPMIYEESLSTAEANGHDRNDPDVQNMAALASVVNVGLETLPPLKILNRLNKAGADDVVQSVFKRMGKDMAGDAAREGFTEVGQMAVNALAHDDELWDQLTTDDKRALMPYLIKEYGKEAALSLIAGGVVGGGMGAGTGARTQMLQNARAEKQVQYLGQAAEGAGVDVNAFNEAAKDPEGIRKIHQAAVELEAAERAREETREAIDYMVANGEEVPAELTAQHEKAVKLADAVHDRWISKEFGGRTAAQIRADKADEDTRRRSDAISTITDGGEIVKIDQDVSTDKLVALADELKPLRDERQTVESLLSVDGIKKKRETRLNDRLNKVLEKEGDIRGRIAEVTNGDDPVAAKSDWIDQTRASIASKLSFGKGLRAEAETNENFNRSVETELSRYGLMPPKAARKRASDVLARADKRKKGRIGKLTAEIEALEQKLEVADANEYVKIAKQIEKKLSQREGETPAVAAARRVMQDYPIDLEAEAQVMPEGDTEGGTPESVDKAEGGGTPEAGLTEDLDGGKPEADAEEAAPSPKPVAAAKDPTLDGSRPQDYFTLTDDTETVPVGDLRPVRARPEGIENAGRFMREAAEGKKGKRKPISVRREGDGTYTVLDGNSTFANMRDAGWDDIPVRVLTDAQFAEESSEKFGQKTGTETSVEGSTIVARGPTSLRQAVESRAKKEGLDVRFEGSDTLSAEDPRRVNDEVDRNHRWEDALDDVGGDATLEQVEQVLKDKNPDVEWAAAFEVDADGNPGRILGYGTNGHDNNVAVPIRPGQGLQVVTHTHPVQVPFSMGDVALLGPNPEVTELRAILPDGQTVVMSRGENFPDSAMALHAKISRVNAEMARIMPPRTAGTQRARILQEAQLRWLDMSGAIDYAVPIEGLTATEEEMINAAIDAVEEQQSGAGLRDDAGARPAEGSEVRPAGEAGVAVPEGSAAPSPRGELRAVNQKAPDWASYSEAEDVWRNEAMASIQTWQDMEAVLPAVEQPFWDMGRNVASKTGTHFNAGPRKSQARSEEKALQKDKVGGGRIGRLNDVVRGMFVVNTTEEAEAVIDEIAAGPYEMLDENWSVTPEGYMDRKLTLRAPGQPVMIEVQLVEPEMYRLKEGLNPMNPAEVDPSVRVPGHKLYEEQRAPGVPIEEMANYGNRMRGIYGMAVRKSDPSIQTLWRSLDPKHGQPAEAADYVERWRPLPERMAAAIDYPASDFGSETGVAMTTSLPKAARLAQENQYQKGRDFKLDLQRIAKETQSDAGIEYIVYDVNNRISPKSYTDEKVDRLADFAFEDAQAALVNNKGAIGWYGRTVDTAKKHLHELHPELATDPEAEFAFTWALAVTSNGLKVDKNFELADAAYEAYKINGIFPTDIGIGEAASAINAGLSLHGRLIKALGGWQAAKDFMTERQSVNLIEKQMADIGVKNSNGGKFEISGEGKKEVLPGAVVLGPKIGGGFFSNLYGNFGELTMDRWLMRTVGRWRGHLVAKNPAMEAKKRGEIRSVLSKMKPDQMNDMRGFFNGYEGRIAPVMSDRDLNDFSIELAKRSTAKGWRDRFNARPYGDRVRLSSNSLAGYLDGQVEQPLGVRDRQFIRKVFAKTLTKLQSQPNMSDLTMSDLQALLWYPEKLMYQAAKKKPGEEIVRYEEDEAPDYANAARKLVANRLGRDSEIRNGSGAVGSGPAIAAATDVSVGRDVRPESWLGRAGVKSITPNQMRSLADTAARETGVELSVESDVTPGAGGWFNPMAQQVETEPSTAIRVDGDPANVRQFAAMMGDMAGQYSVLAADPSETGNAVAVTVRTGMDPLEVFNLARRADPDAFGGFSEVDGGITMLVFDPDGVDAAIDRLADELNGVEGDVEIYADQVQADFLGDTGEEGSRYDIPTGSEGTALNEGQSRRARGAARSVFGLEGPKPTYVSRDVVGGADQILDWARKQGFEDLISPEDMHVTVLYSKEPIDVSNMAPRKRQLSVGAVGRAARHLGDALAVPIASPALQSGHKRYRDIGGSHDWEKYQPHITFKYNPTQEDFALLERAEPFSGRIELGPEKVSDLNAGWEPDPDTPAIAAATDGLGGSVDVRTADWINTPQGRPPVGGSVAKGRIIERGLPGRERARDTFADYRHDFTDYDIANVFSRIQDQGLNGPQYHAAVNKAVDTFKGDVDASEAGPVRKAELKSHADAWGRQKLSSPHYPMTPARAKKVYVDMGEMLEGGRMTEADIAREMNWPRNRAKQVADLARKYYRGSTPPGGNRLASAVDTNTPEFKGWFGDSKVVDADGEPLMAYHATGSEFEVFNTEGRFGSLGAHFGTVKAAEDRAGDLNEYNEAIGRVAITPSIMPVYLRIENPLRLPDMAAVENLDGYSRDWDGEEDVAQHLLLEGIIDIDQFEESRGLSELKDTLEGMGYDGIVYENAVEDAGSDSYIAFRPTQIKSAFNRGTWDPNDPRIAAAIDAPPGMDIAPQSQSVFRSAANVASNPGDFSRSMTQKLEDNFFNRFAPIRRIEEKVKGALGIGMESAYKMAETAVNDSGRNEHLLYYGAAKLGTHGEFTHAPGTVGLRTVFERASEGLSGEARGQALADWMGYMAARRIDELRKGGNTMKFPMTDGDVATYLAKETPAFKDAADMWKKHNAANIDFLVDTGRITKAQAKAMKDMDAYVPFYRSSMNADGSSPDLDLSGLGSGPRSGGTLTKRNPGIMALKGGDKKAIDNLMVNMIRNSQAMVAAGMRNRATNMTVDLMEDAGLASVVPGPKHKKPHKDAMPIWKNGKKKWMIPTTADAAPLIVAMQGLQPLQLGRIQSLMAGISSIFRQGITLSPAFMIRNAIRGATATGLLTSGANLTARNNTWSGFRDALNNGAATKAFKAQSGMADFRFGNPTTGLGKDDILIEFGLEPKTVAYRIRKAIDAAEHVGTATELADRVAAYNTMIERGMRPDEAAYQARAVMDYARKGALPEVRAWLPMVPFLNARLQGYSRMMEGAVGRHGAAGRKIAMKQLALNGMVLMALSGALWARNAFDDDRREKYKAEPLYRRLNYHIIYAGDKTILIPKAFELGHVFSSIPELFGDAMVNDMNEVGPGIQKIIQDTVTFNLIPAAAQPVIEGLTNYDMFRQGPIEGYRERNMKARDRVTGSSTLSRIIGQELGVSETAGLSPAMIEHYLQGYGGTYYLAMASALDIVAGEMGFGSAPVGGAFGDTPLASGALQRALGSMYKDSDLSSTKYMDEFYRTKDYITQIYRSAKDASAHGDVEYARQLLEEAPATPGAYKLVNKAGYRLGKINSAIRDVRADRHLSPSEKRDKIRPLVAERNRLVRGVSKVIRDLEEKQGATFKAVS